MRGYLKLIIFCMAILLPIQVFSAGFGDIRLSYLEGDVQINPEASQEWLPASVNVPLYEGDRIWVPDFGKAELHFRNGTVIRFKERTSADILNYDKDFINLYLNLGTLYINYRDRSKRDVMQVNTPVVKVRAYDRAVFKVEVQSNGYTYISVYRGSVYADHRDGKNVVDEGSMMLIRGYLKEEVYPLSSPDLWTQWNFDRDRLMYSDYRSVRYLPDELRYYSYDFDRYGKWIYVKEYGYCWTPKITLSVGWAPYREGRWAWIRGDYVWISYEPWGWVPYHYGRWAFLASIGWCWVPPQRGAVYWGPGYVGWVYTPTYVSWVPLAPGEIYYGYGYYGPHSVNLINVNINKIVIKEKYKNVFVKDAVTVVHRDNFIAGKEEKVRIKENPFLKENISIGRPNISPERRTMMPVLKEISREKLPPKEIRELDIKGIRERTVINRERDLQMQERLGKPRDKSQDIQRSIPNIDNRQRNNQVQPFNERPTLPDTKRERTREIAPQDIKPDINRQTPQQERLRERTPSEIRKDSPTEIRPTLPDTKRERTREIAPQDIKPDIDKQQQERSQKDTEKRKQSDKDSHGDKKGGEENLKERGWQLERGR
ncbi:MAG: FecR family protein [Thermodesulfovibrionales bacterium]|nr:FecR family protein [Thermodesulfovibrionales bacterium]